MRRPRRNRHLVFALYANAALLAAILITVLSRGTGLGSSAFAAGQPLPIGGGNGSLYLIPTQLLNNVWGCYLMDFDNQTLCMYEYNGGQLKLVSARNVRHDHELTDFNTSPDPRKMKNLFDLEHGNLRTGNPPATQSEGDK